MSTQIESQQGSMSTTLFDDSVRAAAEYNLRNKPIMRWPYSHTLVNSFFEKEYYCEMISAFPDDDAFTPLNKYHPDRGTVFLTPDRENGTDDLAQLDDHQREFWGCFVRMFGGGEFRRALLETLGGSGLVDSHFAQTRSLIHLSLDRKGYQIRPHTDVASKIVTALFYLPDEDDFEAAEFGTSVLVERNGSENSDPHDWSGYDTAFTAPFIANSMFAFRVGENSWHGVKPVSKPIRRRSIQYFVILND